LNADIGGIAGSSGAVDDGAPGDDEIELHGWLLGAGAYHRAA
jgi:hypothetical protein